MTFYHSSEKAQPTRSQMRAKTSSKTDGPIPLDSKRHPRKAESRENSDLSNQKCEKTASKPDLSVPRDANDSSRKGSARECSSRKIDQREEKFSSKTEQTVSKNSDNHSNQIHNWESNKQILALMLESDCPKEPYSISREFKDHSNKKERRENSQQMMVNQNQEKRLSRHDRSTSRDEVNRGSKDTNRVSSQQITNDKRQRDGSKGDRVVSMDFKSHGPKAEIRVCSQQMTSERREKDCSKGDRVVSMDFKSKGPIPQSSWARGKQMMNELKEKHGSKADFPINGDVKDRCDEAEPRDCFRPMSGRQERPPSVMDGALSPNFNQHFTSSDKRTSSPQNDRQRERQSFKSDFSAPRDFRDSCNTREDREFGQRNMNQKLEISSSKTDFTVPMDGHALHNKREWHQTNQMWERPSSKAELPASREYKDSYKINESREWHQTNQMWERPSSKAELPAFREDKDSYNINGSREWHQTNQMWERPSSKAELPASREDNNSYNINGSRQSSPQTMSQMQERMCTMEEHSVPADFKDYCSKNENREVNQHTDNTMRMKPTSRVYCTAPSDSAEQDMINEKRAHSCRVLEEYLKNSSKFFPGPASIKSPKDCNMSAQFRSPFGNFQPQSKTFYGEDFQNKTDMIRDDAATLIQSHWRGYAARQQLCREYDAATIIQAAWRGYITRKNISDDYQASTSPQFNCGGNQARNELRAPQLRAAQIKNEWREFLQQCVFNQHTSPHAFQSQRNEHKSPTELSEKNHAATIIQKWFRGNKTKKSFENLYQASPVTQTNNSARYTLREPPRNLKFAAMSSSDDSSQNYSTGSIDSFNNNKSKPSKTATPEWSDDFPHRPATSFTSPYYGMNIRKPQSQQQQIRGNVLEGVGQGPALSTFSPADSTEESEKADTCCQNPCVARQGQARPLYKYEKMETNITNTMGAPVTTQVYGRPYIPPMPLSIPFSCRRATARGKSPNSKQDRGPGKTLCNAARAGKDISMSNKRDYKVPGPAYSPDTFRRRLMLDFQTKQTHRARDRRKNLYERQPNEQEKVLNITAEQKPAGTAFSPPCYRRPTMSEHSSNPSSFKGRDTFSNSRQHEQEKNLPNRQEPDIPKTPNTINMGNKQANCNCSHGCSLCKAREKSRPLNDNKPHQSKPFVRSLKPETYSGKVTGGRPTGNPKDKANEMKHSMRHNRREDRDELRVREIAHKPPVLPCSSDSSKKKTGCSNCHEPSLDLGQNQSNSSRRQDGRQQPEPSEAEPPFRQTFQYVLNSPLEEGYGTWKKFNTQNQRARCASRECEQDLQCSKDMETPSRRTPAAEFPYTGGKGKKDAGFCNTHMHEIQGHRMGSHETHSDLEYSTFRGPREPSPGAESISNDNSIANEMTDKWVFKTGNRFQKERYKTSPVQSARKSPQTRIGLKQQHNAATRIQALYRGYKVRQCLQRAGIMDKYDNRDKELRKKESKYLGDAQQFSMHSWGSPKGRTRQHHRDKQESRFHSEHQSYRPSLRNVSDGGDLRFNRRSHT
ncbi:uncharacterized protein LOC144799125 [Lissotriton helveticus]